jgi:hypothetical protein
VLTSEHVVIPANGSLHHSSWVMASAGTWVRWMVHRRPADKHITHLILRKGHSGDIRMVDRWIRSIGLADAIYLKRTSTIGQLHAIAVNINTRFYQGGDVPSERASRFSTAD